MTPILRQLEARMKEKRAAIAAWFAEQFAATPPFFYSSVDLRHSGFKLAPVDTNLFPAGFNNLSPAARLRAAEVLAEYFSARHPGASRILLIPENHTRNLGYLENVAVLTDLLAQAGREVRIGGLAVASGSPLTLGTLSGREIAVHPVRRQRDRIATEDGFTPDLIVVNNDFSSGSPDILHCLEQPVLPPVGMGWYRRRKSEHFAAYGAAAHDLARMLEIDPWLISAYFHRCGEISFRDRQGIECVALAAEKVLHLTRRKYEEYGIPGEPYVFIKADSGTYGMGIMTARSGDELYAMNKKTRNKMNVIKEGAVSSAVIIQEGVPTADRVGGAAAEPVMYLFDGRPVGGAWRINAERGAEGNLNATGMAFTGMCDEDEAQRENGKVALARCDFHVFGMIAKLATLAAAREHYREEECGEEQAAV